MSAEQRAFGERLRRHREGRGITLEQIADETKVAAALFAGLERGDCGRWPGGMYNRSFVRAYGAAVGLDLDEIAAEFAELFEATSMVVKSETQIMSGNRSLFQVIADWAVSLTRSAPASASSPVSAAPSAPENPRHAVAASAGSTARDRGVGQHRPTSRRGSSTPRKRSKGHPPVKARA